MSEPVRRGEAAVSGLIAAAAARAQGPAAGLRQPPKNAIVFGGGLPDPTLRPRAALLELSQSILGGADSTPLNYAYEAGVVGLREAIAQRHRLVDGVELDPDQVIVTNGASGAFALVAATLIDPGDIVLCEALTYPGALNAFRLGGARVVPIAMDDGGIDVEALEGRLRQPDIDAGRVKFLYTITTCHSPTGTTLSEGRRQRLAELAEEFDLLLVQDNTYGEIRFSPAPPSLLAYAPTRTIHIGSFSKTVAPGLRVGWMAAPSSIAEVVRRVRTDLGTSPLPQQVLAAFMADGRYAPHVAHVSGKYEAKRDVLLRELEANCSPWCRWSTPDGGFVAWVTLNDLAVSAVAEIAHHEGVAFLPGSYFSADGADVRGLRLAYGELPKADLVEGVRRLAVALERASKAAR